MSDSWSGLESIYIHWPFCPYRCSFCPFVALSGHDRFMEQYHKALCKEIEQFGKSVGYKLPIRTIFFGGGTPSTYPDNLLLDIFAKLKSVFFFVQDPEITIEVNPGTVCFQQLKLWKEIGINRISIGVQSLNADVLRRLNRHHTSNDVHVLLTWAAQFFENISVDLMAGLPGVVSKEWQALLDEIVRWPIKHISIYCLMVHEKTKLYYEYKQNKVTIPDDDMVAMLYERAVNVLTVHGFEQYEVSNFARRGYESKHNIAYWDYKPYKGFGLGAWSFDGDIRSQNTPSLVDYIDTIEKERFFTAFEEQLSANQKRLEKIMLGLRTVRGLSLEQMFDGLSCKEKECFKKNIEWLKQNNFMIEDNGCLQLSLKGLIIEHEIVARFFSEKS